MEKPTNGLCFPSGQCKMAKLRPSVLVTLKGCCANRCERDPLSLRTSIKSPIEQKHEVIIRTFQPFQRQNKLAANMEK